MVAASALFVCFLVPATALASFSKPDDVPLFLWRLFVKAAAEYSVPVNTLTAISGFESGFNIYACNFAGQAKYFDTKEEALWAIEEFRRMDYGVMFGETAYYGNQDVIIRRVKEHAEDEVTIILGGEKLRPMSKSVAIGKLSSYKGRSFDVGLMQINSHWIRKYDISVRDLLDPEFNILFGAWVLRESFNDYGLGVSGIGGYHTNPKRNPERSLWYAKKVLSSHKRLFGF